MFGLKATAILVTDRSQALGEDQGMSCRIYKSAHLKEHTLSSEAVRKGRMLTQHCPIIRLDTLLRTWNTLAVAFEVMTGPTWLSALSCGPRS